MQVRAKESATVPKRVTKVEKKAEAKEAATASTADTSVPDYSVIVGLKKTNLPDLARRIRELDEMKSEIEIELKALKEQGAELMQRYSVKSVMAGGLRVTRVDGVSTNLIKTKLIELGVGIGVIEKATTRTNYTSLKVSVPKGESGE